jgi:hypothetical protein
VLPQMLFGDGAGQAILDEIVGAVIPKERAAPFGAFGVEPRRVRNARIYLEVASATDRE